MFSNQHYRQELHFIRETIRANEFQLFFTFRDLRPKNRYRKFRSTDPLGEGYRYRVKVTKRLMSLFRKVYGIRGGRNRRCEVFYFGVHEASVGRDHWLHEDSAHIHLLIGFKPDSRYYNNPRTHLEDFIRQVDEEKDLRWLDCCFSEKNKQTTESYEKLGPDTGYTFQLPFKPLEGKDFEKKTREKDAHYTIQNQEKIASYLAKAELGTINGECFSKQPFWSRDVTLPPVSRLRLPPLPQI